MPGFAPKVLIFPDVDKDGIGTYISGLERHLPVSKLAYRGKILSPGQFLASLPNGFDVIHVPHFLVPFATGKAKVVCTIQDIIPLFDESLSWLHKAYLRLRIQWSLSKADHVIFTSEATREDVASHFGKIPNHTIIPLACDDPVAPRVPDDSPYSFRYFFHVGRRRSHKNVENIILALADPTVGREVRLVLGGRKDLDDDRLIESAIKAGVGDRIHFSGYLSKEQLVSHYRHAEALVFPSLREGFGIPILEAMSHGCAVITSNCSSMPEVAGGAAVLVDPHDKSSIAKAMAALESDPVFREKLREKGFKNVQRFGWRKTAEATDEVYRRLANEDGQAEGLG
jgi:glycosyltransferase involved in cell wall biosynthesis